MEVTKSFSWLSLLSITLIVLMIFGVGYSAFVKRTNQTIVQSGGSVINAYDNGENAIPLVGCNLYKLRLESEWLITENSVNKAQATANNNKQTPIANNKKK